ncbi:PIN domain-containing protein [Natronobacterium gregoryi]|uniref:PIN domain-containing protein n=2 Tax=Natronobacterium gregoryi TaxID=44930 RepID=L0ANB4_NATGS|nr:PIN domain-containing protein [Natronobacterium gregoryi]AFZ74677.1 PIN domain-containing protein [Natronobacterium gregoryi SP2]ELY73418.1 PilT protein domain-containing protein [Natronobacterium gregoryi SP2]PLK20923.1 PIN domain-containing protein [Natronobacterium gregoryi SP2]SFJ05044.1 PIN domain-containing protein [Natronobacterium gregoryi]
MTVYVETDFLLALVKDSDWLQQSAEEALDEYDVETSAVSYLELLLARERYEFDYVPLVANLLELVPVRDEEERQIVLKAVNYYDEGMTAFDAFHAATAETRTLDVLSSEKDYEDIEVERVPLEPADE